MSEVKTDCSGSTIEISNASSIVRVDGIAICKRIVKRDGVYLQFADRDKQRSGIRGTRFVEVRLDAWINKIS